MDLMLQKIWAYFWLPETKYVIVAAVGVTLLSLRMLAKERRRVAATFVVFLLCLVGQLVGAMLEALDYSRLAVMLHEIFVIGSGMALFRLLAIFVFRAILPRVGIVVARIAEDISVLLVYGVFILARLHFVGLDPSSLLTTSAVITAVLAFAMQDTLGNILAGVALQLDNSLRTGDWIRIDDVNGRVAQVRWRQTTIRTRNGEVVVVPNSQLMRGRFTVYGREEVASWPWRRWVWFNLTYDSPPTQVIAAVETAISVAEIPNVADDPRPSCVLMEFGPGYARYALRYWMIDPQADDPTDSAVRVHLLAALQRGGMELAVPEQSLLVTKENEAHRKSIQRREGERRLADLRRFEIFSSLQEDELLTISAHLIHAPFVSGDVIYRQGDVAHWLYLLTAGEADVWLQFPEQPRQLFRTIEAGSTFGERGVLTGELRRDTVIARSDLVCYRLDQATVQQLIQSRPAIAEAFAGILARREQEMNEFSHRYVAETPGGTKPETGMLDRIRAFLGL
ncbi:MAG: mechanosensitive ion channel [Candidatus Accumulibacter sp.]|jgi:small-conductance mechanosensitive channel/CRP-like cAMP-binding protein|nr:mechanosensitive ion channel [Candidatus Accumulibacter conexus]